jgi:competence protein ComGC
MIEEQLQRDLEVKEVVKRFVRQYKLDKNLVERSVRQLIDDGFPLEYEEMHKQLVERLSIRGGSNRFG